MHFTLTGVSWLNIGERSFRDILQKVIRADERLSFNQKSTLHGQYFLAKP